MYVRKIAKSKITNENLTPKYEDNFGTSMSTGATSSLQRNRCKVIPIYMFTYSNDCAKYKRLAT